jgi:hypothetical protein
MPVTTVEPGMSDPRYITILSHQHESAGKWMGRELDWTSAGLTVEGRVRLWRLTSEGFLTPNNWTIAYVEKRT